MENAISIVDYFLIRDGRIEVFLFCILFMFISVLLGSIFRRNIPEALLFGLLVLFGSANLAVFVSRALALDLRFFGWGVLICAFSLSLTFRYVLSTGRGFDFRVGPSYIASFILLAAAVWFSQILMTEPSAGMSSHQAWYPLYLQESFAEGAFLGHSDMRFAPGFMASLLFNVDLLGAAAFGTWIGADAGYSPFLGATIASGMACIGLLGWGLRRNALILWCGIFFFLVYFRFDPDFRLVFGSNWGDVIMYVAGAGMIHYLMDDNAYGKRYLLVSCIALFLPFGRSFGVMYAVLICAFCLFLDWREKRVLNLRPWIVVFFLGCLFSSRELFLIATKASPFYDSSRYLLLSNDGVWSSIIYNIGIDFVGRRQWWMQLFYALPLIVATVAVATAFADKTSKSDRIFATLLPLFLLLPPICLALITGGYGLGAGYSKLYTFTLFIHVYYPWRLLARADRGRQWVNLAANYRTRIIGFVAAIAVLGAIFLKDKIQSHRIFRDGMEATFSWAFETYRNNNADLLVARELEKLPALLERARTHPILYFHYEPGLALRYFIGGLFFDDLDYWSAEVFDAIESSESLEIAVRRLGNPLLYISYGSGLVYGNLVQGDTWRKFSRELITLDEADWIASTVSAGGARLYFPKDVIEQTSVD